MAAATNAARGRIWIKETPPSALYPMPITTATPRMISQMGLVCLPAAVNAAAGRRIASMKAHTSMTSAASERTSKNQKSGVSDPALPNTVPGYPLPYTIRAVSSGLTAHLRRLRRRLSASRRRLGVGPKHSRPRPVPRRGSLALGAACPAAGPAARGPAAGLGGRAVRLGGRAVEGVLGGCTVVPVEGALAVVGEHVVLVRRLGPGALHVRVRATGQRPHRAVNGPDEPPGQLPQRLRGQHPGARGRVHRLAARDLANLVLHVNAVHSGFSLPFRPAIWADIPACRPGRHLCVFFRTPTRTPDVLVMNPVGYPQQSDRRVRPTSPSRSLRWLRPCLVWPYRVGPGIGARRAVQRGTTECRSIQRAAIQCADIRRQVIGRRVIGHQVIGTQIVRSGAILGRRGVLC